MTIPHSIPVSSINSIANSIKTDTQVYQWFIYALSNKAIKSELLKNDGLKKLYGDWEKSLKLYVLTLLILILILLTALLAKIFFLALNGLVVLYPLHTIDKKIKNTVSQISIQMLLSDLEESMLKHNTLYQIGEYYAQKHSIASLVDIIYFSDDISRKLLAILLIIALTVYIFIYQFPIWATVICIALAYVFLKTLLNSTLIYSRIK